MRWWLQGRCELPRNRLTRRFPGRHLPMTLMVPQHRNRRLSIRLVGGLVALWSPRDPTTTKDDRKRPRTKGDFSEPFRLFVQVIGGSVRGLIIRCSPPVLPRAGACPGLPLPGVGGPVRRTRSLNGSAGRCGGQRRRSTRVHVGDERGGLLRPGDRGLRRLDRDAAVGGPVRRPGPPQRFRRTSRRQSGRCSRLRHRPEQRSRHRRLGDDRLRRCDRIPALGGATQSLCR